MTCSAKHLANQKPYHRDARELVSELEFVWDQIKSNNVSSTSSSSPPKGSYHRHSSDDEDDRPMRILSPMSQNDDEELIDDGDEEAIIDEDEDDERGGIPRSLRRSMGPSRNDKSDKWRRRVEQALTKMTAEVAALREQLENKRTYKGIRKRGVLAWAGWLIWNSVKHFTIDLVLLGLLLLWMRRRKDKRLEMALRMVWSIMKKQIPTSVKGVVGKNDRRAISGD
jgi:hypothetical protein